MISGLLLFLIIVNVYLLMVFLLARSGILTRYNIGLMGPIMMFRTERGKGIIDWLGKAKRFHHYSGTIGIWVTLFCMGALMLLLIIQMPFVLRIPAEQAPQARHILALPGINPLIPVVYGIIALVVAIVIHEFAHGVLARAQDLKVKTLGMLYLIVPIGAFVEPDEEEMQQTTRKKRMRVYAAGPMSNIITALVLGLVFSAGFMAAAHPIADGLGVDRVVPDSPADQAGLEEGVLITQIEDTHVTDLRSFRASLENTHPGQTIDIETHDRGTLTACLASHEDAQRMQELGPGVDWCQRYPSEMPAGNTTDRGDGDDALPVTMHAGPIMGGAPLVVNFSLEAETNGDEGLTWTFDATGNGTIDASGTQQELPVEYTHTYEQTGRFTATFTLENETASFTRTATVNMGGFLGIQTYPFSPAGLQGHLENPFGSVTSLALYVALPFTGMTPMTAPFTDFYEVPVGDNPLAVTTYWVSANIVYWVMWISLMLGLTNALPAVPLDGGWLFRDFLDSVIQKLKPKSTAESRAPIVKKSSIAISLLVLGLILFQFLGPRIAPFFM